MLPMTSTIWAYNEFLTDGLFKNAEFPTSIEKDLVIETIMIKYGELEPLFQDADFMQMACTSWAKKWYHSFDRWNYALMEEYNPLHNYDRYEDITEENSETNSGNTNSSNSTTGNESGTSTNTRSSFDSSTYQPHDQTNTSGNSSISNSANSNSSTNSNGNLIRNAHLYGNIGVVSSAQMLEGEIQVRKNNIYDLIADCFETELCLMVY